MTERDRALAVFRGEVPDRVPWFADLSHWYAATFRKPFLPLGTEAWDRGMVDLHRQVQAGLYLNMGTFWDVVYEGEVTEEVMVQDDLFVYALTTPLGRLEEHRRFSPISYSWPIEQHMIRTVEDLAIVRFAMARRRCVPRYERYHVWAEATGGLGLPFACGSYSGLGYLISRYMGVAETYYALHDAPAEVEETIAAINAARLREIDVLAASPSPVILFSDNLSSATQPPPLFARYSVPFYREMCRRAHAAGKWVSIHLDGALHGLLGLLAECGVDCIDAVTPAPLGDLTPEECRTEAGPNLILWGGLPAPVWLPQVPEEVFVAAVRRWLDLRHLSPRLVLAPGDQVPPGAERRRIERVIELVEEYGRYR